MINLICDGNKIFEDYRMKIENEIRFFTIDLNIMEIIILTFKNLFHNFYDDFLLILNL